MGSRKTVVLGVTLLLLTSGAYGAVKRWKGTQLSWQDPGKWHGGQLPCSADLVQFDETWAPSAVYIQNSISVYQLTLPMDGDLVLGDINITISHDTTCAGKLGQHLTYVSPAPGDWDNPLNWETVSGDKVVDNTKSPPADRLPCKKDTVVFPPNTSVSVKVTRQVEIGSLVIDSVVYNTPDLATAYLSSHVGASQVRRISLNSLTVTGDSCGLGSVCKCGNSICSKGSALAKSTQTHSLTSLIMQNPMIRRSSCSYSTPSCTAVIDCINPVQLADDCCATCGALFNITVGSGFKYDSFKTALAGKLKTFNYRLHVFNSSMVQLLVVGVKGQELSNQLISELRSPAFTLTSTSPITVQKSAPHPTSPPTTIAPTTIIPTTTLPTTTAAQPTTSPRQPSSSPGVVLHTQDGQTGQPTDGGISTVEDRTRLATLCATLKEGEQAGNAAGQSGSSSSSSSTDKEPWYILAAMAGVFMLFAVVLILYLVTKQKQGQKEMLRTVTMHSIDGMRAGRLGFENPAMAFHQKDGEDDAFVQLVNNGEPMAAENFGGDGMRFGGKNNPLYDSVEQVKRAMEKEFQE